MVQDVSIAHGHLPEPLLLGCSQISHHGGLPADQGAADLRPADMRPAAHQGSADLRPAADQGSAARLGLG